MKKITLLLSGICLILGANAQTTFTDGFEADTVGKLGPQSPVWTTWSKADGGEEDVMVIDSANHTTGGSKSIYFSSTEPNGGPTDVILPFASKPLTTGKFTFNAWFKVPKDQTAYFNFQGDTINGNIFTFECKLDAGGTLVIEDAQNEVVNTSYPSDIWFKITIDVNLNTSAWVLLIDDVVKGKWKNSVSQVAAADFFPANPNARFFVDDVSYTHTPYVLPNLNGGASDVGVSTILAGQKKKPIFTIRNLGKTAITSFDVSVSHNGGTPVKETVTIPSLASYEKSSVLLKSSFTLVAGDNQFTAILSNVNGAGADGDAIDDTTSVTFQSIEPAPGKMVFAEDITATWLDLAPRGIVARDVMKEEYKGYFVGVAAHMTKDTKTDPMALRGYANLLDSLVTKASPTVVVDRSYYADPLGLENLILQRITSMPEGLLLNGAEYNPTTRELKVSITTTLQNDIAGDYRVACVITEDSVSGTTPDYDQANAYAGNTKGAMGGFELLPNPVPAAQMNYNDVVRAFSPTPDGLPNAYGASATAGQKIIHNFIYTIPASWDANQLSITSLIIKPSLAVNNANQTSLKDAIKNGFVTGTVVGIEQLAEEANAITLAPNPANDFSVITVNLKSESTVSVEIYSITGALIESKSYGKLNGAFHLPVETNKLVSGLYLVRVNVNNHPTVLKLVKE